MSQKKVQKEEEKPSSGPLRKHRSRAEKIDDLKKQISELRKAEREERQRYIDLNKLVTTFLTPDIWNKLGVLREE